MQAAHLSRGRRVGRGDNLKPTAMDGICIYGSGQLGTQEHILWECAATTPVARLAD